MKGVARVFDMSLPILAVFAGLGPEAGGPFICGETKKITRRLRNLFDEYDEFDWPLLVFILEVYTERVKESLEPDAREIYNSLRKKWEADEADPAQEHDGGEQNGENRRG